MANWPTWFEGKELTAQDFFQLERFLLERSALVSHESTGIERFDLATSIKVTAEGAVLDVRCRNLIGVGSAGHPVCLKENELATRVQRSEIRDDTFHAWIEVNPHLEDTENGQKLRLLVSSSEIPSGDRLHLGQFRLDGSNLEFVSRPKVRRFAGMLPWDASWQKWVRPFTQAISKRLTELESRRPPFTLAAIAYSTELCRLVAEWAALPMEELFQRVQMVKLLGNRNKLTDEVASDYWNRLNYPLTEMAKSDEWPQLLADELSPGTDDEPAPEDVGFGTLIGAHQAVLGLRPQDQSVLAEFLADMSGRSVYLLVSLECRPPIEIEFMIVSKGKDDRTTVVAAGLLQGTVRGSHMTYPLSPTPQQGHKVRFRPFQQLGTADKVRLTFLSEKVPVAT